MDSSRICDRIHFHFRIWLDRYSVAGKHWKTFLMRRINTLKQAQYGPEIAPLKYRHLGGAFGSQGEWSK